MFGLAPSSSSRSHRAHVRSSAARGVRSFAKRLVGPALAATLVMATACGKEGSYVVALKFGTADGPAEDVSARGCGFHGVGSWRLFENGDDAGDYPCGASTITRHTKPGTYIVSLVGFDPEGLEKARTAVPAEGTPLYLSAVLSPAVVVEDGKTTVVDMPAFLRPLPECADGVDNDCDGRVDAKDPACAPATVASCSRTQPCDPRSAAPFCQLFVSSGDGLGTCLPEVAEASDDVRGALCAGQRTDAGAAPADAGADATPALDAQGDMGAAGGAGGAGGGNGGTAGSGGAASGGAGVGGAGGTGGGGAAGGGAAGASTAGAGGTAGATSAAAGAPGTAGASGQNGGNG